MQAPTDAATTKACAPAVKPDGEPLRRPIRRVNADLAGVGGADATEEFTSLVEERILALGADGEACQLLIDLVDGRAVTLQLEGDLGTLGPDLIGVLAEGFFLYRDGQRRCLHWRVVSVATTAFGT
ncbi:hypothetical protein D3C78_693660 [compost metagenome]